MSALRPNPTNLRTAIFCLRAAALVAFSVGAIQESAAADVPALRTGGAAYGDWTTDAPGVRRRLVPRDMPAPKATRSAANFSHVVARPEGALPRVPPGFRVEEFARGLKEPRIIVTAPNGDIFVAESSGNRIRILRDADGDGKPELNEVFVAGLNQPFGIAFYPPGPNPKFIYIGNTDGVVRFPYTNGQTKASGPSQAIVSLPGGGLLAGGGHWTRDVKFSADGRRLFVSIGSRSNNDDSTDDERRARILEFSPDGKNERVYASGLRNAVGMAVEPATGVLWATCNERDGLGDDLPPDYVTRIKEGGFYGWPWFYIGSNADPKHAGKHAELADRVIVPDVLLQPHSAPLGMTFYTGKKFPAEYRGQAFVAFHGSWNRANRTGYKVVRLPIKDGKPTGEYVDFMVGLVTPDGGVWGRPVGVTTTSDGALLVTDDGGNRIWRISAVEK
jgi:glucose/arabinose dehydrogenase